MPDLEYDENRPQEDPDEAQGEDVRMPFLEHLRELRKRLIISLISVVVGFIGAWAFHKQLFQWLMEPYEAAILAIPDGLHELILSQVPESGVSIEVETVAIIHYAGLVTPFFVYLKTALLAGVFLSIPVIFWQIWRFISPGLYKKERLLAGPFIVGTTLFFFFGAGFCRYMVMEPAVAVLLSIGAQNTEPMIMMQEYFGLISRFLLVFGVVFEMPVAVMFLAVLGLITHETLIRHWRGAVIVMFVLGALLTPPDPFTQIALATPLIALYILSILIAYIFSRNREKRIMKAMVESRRSETH